MLSQSLSPLLILTLVFGPLGMEEMRAVPSPKAAQAEGPQGVPRIDHEPLRCMEPSAFPEMNASVIDEVSLQRTRVYFKAHQFPDWYFVDMKLDDAAQRPAAQMMEPSRYIALLPQPLPGTIQVDYYVYVLDSRLQTAQTDEYQPAVAKDRCLKAGTGVTDRRESNPQIVIGGTKEGQPPVPPGFSKKGIVAFLTVTGLTITGAALSGGAAAAGTAAGGGAATAGVAGGAAVGAGGISVATVLTVVGVGAAVAGVAASTGGGKSSGSTTTTLSSGNSGAPPPTPSTPSAPTPSPTPAPANNQPPNAVFKVSPSPPQGAAPLEVDFNMCQSTDPDGDSLQFDYDLGDGTPAGHFCRVTHTYSAGNYSASSCVTDGRSGHERCQSYTVKVTAVDCPSPPTPTFVFPPDGATVTGLVQLGCSVPPSYFCAGSDMIFNLD